MNQNIILLGTILAIAAISAPMVINYTSEKTPQSESLLPICTSTRETYNDPPICVNTYWPDYPNYIDPKDNFYGCPFNRIYQNGECILVETTFEYSHTFPKDKSGQYEKWCNENNGHWVASEVRCGFDNKIDSMKADAALEDKMDAIVDGKHARFICEKMQIECSENPKFEASFSLELARTYVTQFKYEIEYVFYFDESDPDRIGYKICNTDNDKEYRDCEWTKEYVH